MPMQRRDVVFLFLLIFSFFPTTFVSGATLPQDEIEALKQIGKTLGKHDWDFSADPCSGERGWLNITPPKTIFANNVTCNCTYTDCHVIIIVLRGQNLQGMLPPELAKLPFLQEIDLTLNYLRGTIPSEWGSIPLMKISLYGNRITGPIPKELWNISTLTDLVLEANMFSGESGPLLQGIEKLVSIKRIFISSNAFSGQLPTSLANLINLTDFRINDNNFTGRIPGFIGNWTKLARLEIQGSGLHGPIPSGISSLVKLTDLRISDIHGTTSPFPNLDNLTGIRTLILRNCNLTRTIPDYVWTKMTNLRTLDLSFNKLEGHLPPTLRKPEAAVFIFLTSNLLNGRIPEELKKVNNVDLSYNNFTPASTKDCQDLNINLFGSPPTANNLSGAVPPCLKDFDCPKSLLCKFYINCGGEEVTVHVNGTHRATTFTKDQDTRGAARYIQSGEHWAFSSTGYFLDNDQEQDVYIGKNISRLTMPDSQLYTTARLSPLSLTYYGLCLCDGSYTVKLHFAEIMFSDDKSYSSLGKRIFDIYIQGKLVWKDFNIVAEAGGTHKAVVRNFTANVTTNTLEIRFYWAGKGTQSIPDRGIYGPLISAISVESVASCDFKPPGDKKIPAGAVIGIVAFVFCVIFLIIGILWWKGCFRKKSSMYKDLKRLDLQTGSFTLRQLKAATNNFDTANKIGEGGFGPVYKGLLYDGTIIAVKQLSSKSKQGNREFVNEIGMISALQHPNLVKLYGCCIGGNQLLLVYEYMENNSLARALFGLEEQQLKLDWPTRHHICVGIARGLAYLHEESRLKIVHRDIKATNVLLDKDLNPKISDFGLAKLDEEENTHISTRIAGTIGYMAPEYATRGYLTDKADVYSFGIVALEIVSGKSNTNYKPKSEGIYLLDWAYVLQEKGSLIELVDPKLGSEFNKEEAIGMITIALLCTNTSSTLRPTMSAVVSMLEGRTDVQNHISESNLSSDDLDIKDIRSHHQQIHSQEQNLSQSQSILIDRPQTVSSASTSELYPIIMDSDYWSNKE